MIVCVCKGLNERDIDAHVDAGCHTVRALGRATGAGTDCGACVPELCGRLQAKGVRRETRLDVAPMAEALAAK